MGSKLSPQQTSVMQRLNGGEALYWCLDGWFQFGTAGHAAVAKDDLPSSRVVDALIRSGALVLCEQERAGDLIPVRKVVC